MRQYADDTTFYLHSKVSALAQCSVELNGVLSRLGDYSESSNLTLNCSKTKWMLISTPQMARVHNLDVCSVPVACREITLVHVYKITWCSTRSESKMERSCQVTSHILLWNTVYIT